jgi:PIN domain nuclease of toxin-antitoxin system
MRLLLDTHSFLWYVLNDRRLSANARGLISDPSNQIEVSPASYWEIAIKVCLGKYTLNAPYDDFMQRGITGNGFAIRHIDPQHTSVLTTLPMHHRDPFDRLLIAQAMIENIPIVSGDPAFDAYPVRRFW